MLLLYAWLTVRRVILDDAIVCRSVTTINSGCHHYQLAKQLQIVTNSAPQSEAK